MTWKVAVTKPAQKPLDRLPEKDRERVAKALVALANSPFQGDVRRMKAGIGGSRLRVGNYRVFIDLHRAERLITVTRIERRTSTTY